LLLLEAFQACGEQRPLNPATRVADEPLRIDLPSGPWEPGNAGNRYRGVVDLRESLRLSLNVPFVRVSRWCGEEPTAERMRRAGLSLPDNPPPSYALGAVETTPLELAGAYTVFASRGRAAKPFGIHRIEKPSGNRIARFQPKRTFVVDPATAYLIRDLMRDAVESGTGARAAIEGVDVAGKTGSTRDAWFVGDAAGIVAVAWVGLDEGDLGQAGGRVAAPMWKRFMARAAAARAPREVERPRNVVTRVVDPESGLLLSSQPLAMALVASPSGWLSDRIGTRPLAVAGMVAMAAGLLGLSFIGPATHQLTVAGQVQQPVQQRPHSAPVFSSRSGR